MKNNRIFTAIAFFILATAYGNAQSLRFDDGKENLPSIILSTDSAEMNYRGDFTSVAVASNCDFNITSNADWLDVKQPTPGNISVFGKYNYLGTTRWGTVTFKSKDGKAERTFTVGQQPNTMSTNSTDQKISIKSATASQYQSGNEISKSYDGNLQTMYHSPWGNGTHFPVTLTYNLNEASHVDYVIYTPRQDGATNGNFKVVTIQYKLGTEASWKELKTVDLNGSSSASRIQFGENGIDNISSVRFIVKSGVGDSGEGFAACAEMAYYQTNKAITEGQKAIFADALCSQLKPGITIDDINQLQSDAIKSMAYLLYNTPDYNTKFRINEFKPYRPVIDLQSELKTSYRYNDHENPTGIFFEKGNTYIVIAQGIGDDAVGLTIRGFSSSQYPDPQSSSYALANGINIIKAQNRGNGYISYYTPNFQTAPKVKLHFFNGTVNGYFDITRGDTNTDWQQLLANAKSDIMDYVGERIQGAIPVSALKQYCPTKGKELVELYDNIVKYEHEVMGIDKYNRFYGNHMAMISVKQSGGLYHASNDGFCIPINALEQPVSQDLSRFDFWGAGHELGHVNQTNGVLWVGLTEVTNNIYSAYVEHRLRPAGYHRLENEDGGFRYYDFYEYSILKGGQFLPSAHNDVFVTLIPFWQLFVYTHEAGNTPDAYPALFEIMRTMDLSSMNDGQKQVNFMRQWCHVTKTNFIPYFKQVGMFKTVNQQISDYSSRQLTITQTMLNNLEKEITEANYPEAPAGLVYININNKDAFANKAVVAEGTLNSGCTNNGTYVRIQHQNWPNVVGFETYDADGKLLHMTNYGRGISNGTATYTDVVWTTSEKPSYIMAVSYDGSKVKCYQK